MRKCNIVKKTLELYFWKNERITEPRKFVYHFTFGFQTLSIGFLEKGFCLKVPWDDSLEGVEPSRLMTVLCQKQYKKNIVRAGAKAGSRLYSLIYNKPFPNLETIFVRLPDERIVRSVFPTMSLLGSRSCRFDPRWKEKRIAEKVIALRQRNKRQNVILNVLISARFEPNNFTRFSLAYPAVEAFVEAVENNAEKESEAHSPVEVFLKSYLKGDESHPKNPKKEPYSIRANAARLVNKTFSYVGKNMNDACEFREWVKKPNEVNEDPCLNQWINEHKKRKKDFSCSPLKLLLVFAPHRFRCDRFHASEPNDLYLSTVDDWSYKGAGIYADFLLDELEKRYLDILSGRGSEKLGGVMYPNKKEGIDLYPVSWAR